MVEKKVKKVAPSKTMGSIAKEVKSSDSSISEYLCQPIFWQILSGVLAVLLVVSVVFLCIGGSDSSSSALTPEDAKAKLSASFSRLTASPVNIKSVILQNGVYVYSIDAAGNSGNLYSSADMNLVFFDAMSYADLNNYVDYLNAQLKSSTASDDTSAIVNIAAGDDPFVGSADAPVTIIEFSDFECPFCAKFHSETYPQIYENYIKSGKVKFVYKDYPLPIHANARSAALAANCAIDQDKYWEMHDVIFKNQSALGITNLKSYAEELGLDMAEFNDCFDSGKYNSEIDADMAELNSQTGGKGTPFFLVNGKQISGAMPYSSFSAAIDEELAKVN